MSVNSNDSNEYKTPLFQTDSNREKEEVSNFN